jgi:hypothetical protein
MNYLIPIFHCSGGVADEIGSKCAALRPVARRQALD